MDTNITEAYPSYIGMGNVVIFVNINFKLGDKVVAIQRGILVRDPDAGETSQLVIQEQVATTETTDYHEQCYAKLYNIEVK
jgi:hypothetical protein